MRLVLPKLYVILDAALLTTPETDCARQLADVGVRLLQYRNKQASARELLHTPRGLSGLLGSRGVSFVVTGRHPLHMLSCPYGFLACANVLFVAGRLLMAQPWNQRELYHMTYHHL